LAAHDGNAGHSSRKSKILREAYVKTLSLPKPKKARMDVEPTSGEELESRVKEIFDSPPEVIERVKRMLAN